MKKVCIFIGGVVTGAILVVVVSMLIAGGNSTYKGITLFEKEGECISENSFKVFQVLDSGEALALSDAAYDPSSYSSSES